ncbi:FAD-dependent thymidylate synthase [Natranaerobius trueperi]|uniref:Flavin-dependent thymidylate synthase n=1 Tax=Natranaerobius trueperi TaxID=759412 RepID=A0A226C244_9FIRM|nr:FAD-dependent thymidylate synthase [Natranaerobius trueperi]OWZ84509.1 thymidylate synthase (FAD) [Natranaerobius trueperi]
MKVKLVNFSQEPDRTVAAAARLCYSPKGSEQLWNGLDTDKAFKLIKKLKDMDHQSPFEHVNFTFTIDGVSRTLSHQLVRHRIASYSQKSQRYVSEDNFDYVIPPSIESDPNAKEQFIKAMSELNDSYRKLKKTVPKEDARYLLPNACETQLVATFNARSLFNFFRLRCCNRAQWEIRKLAKQMLYEVKEVAPVIFEKEGAQCDVDGTCPEGSKSCGKYKGVAKKEL